MFDLSGKTALVTGSTQGIGFEVAKLLSQQGAKVFVSGASSEEKCIEASKKIPNSIPVRADLLKDEELDRLYEMTGDVDILVINASIQYKNDWLKITKEEYDIQMTCNVKSSFFLIQKYAPAMKKKGWGRIVTVGSVNQYNQHPELPIYGMTKAAQYKMVQNLAPSLARFGVTVNNVAPGAIETPRNTQALADEDFKTRIENDIPCGFVGTPADVAPCVLLLCSEEGRYITGSEIMVDGGYHL